MSSSSSKVTDDSPDRPIWRHDAPDFVPRIPYSHITFTHAGFQPSYVENYYSSPMEPWSPSAQPDYYYVEPSWRNPPLVYWDDASRPKVSHQQLLQVVLFSKKRITQDLKQDWITSIRAFMKWASGDVTEPVPPIYDSPFSHPFAYWLIPPPRLRYIHTSFMDAGLYALRNPKDDTASMYELTSTGDAGFENGTRNDWLIALIGFFYYALPALRLSVAKHTCQDSVCWACELSFLFRSLDVGRSEGHGQPVRTDKFCESLFRSAPTTIGLTNKPADTDFNPSTNCEDIRVSHQLRLAFSSRQESRPWLRARSQRRQKSSPVDIDPLEDKRRERVAKAVRRTEAEKRAEQDQKMNRQRLHNRFHQVMNYLLHAFGSTDDQLFCIHLETETICRAAGQRHRSAPADATSSYKASVVPTPAYVLEVDHSPWSQPNLAEQDGEMSSYPVSTAHSFRCSASSRPSSSSSSLSSRPEESVSSFESTVSPPPPMRESETTFVDLLKAAMWRTNQVQMVCNSCENKSRSSAHTVVQKVHSLPPVLAVKIKLHSDRADPLRFWRSFRTRVPLPWWRPGWRRDRRISTLFPRGLRGSPDDDGDMSRLMSHWLRLHRASQTKKGTCRQQKLKALTKTLRSAIDGHMSPLPNRVFVKYQAESASNRNPWELVDARDISQELDSSWQAYDLVGVVVSVNHVWSRLRRATAWRIWTHDIALRLPTDDFAECFNHLEAEEATLEAPPNEDQFVLYVKTPGPKPGESRWLMINGPVVAEASDEETRMLALPWKYPCALFFGRTDKIWATHLLRRLPPPPPSLPPAHQLFNEQSISQAPLALRRPLRFVPLSPDEIRQIETGNWTIAMDAEHVVVDFVKKSPSSLLAKYPQLALARMSLVRAHGGPNDGTPFFDPYVVFRDEPLDYRTEFSGLYPGDLEQKASVHFLCTHKTVYQAMRYLVERKCKFIGHDLFNDFRVLGLIVPQEQIIDTVAIFRRSIASRFLSLKFLCHYVLNKDIQLYTHDSIEDAQAALALYRFYLEYVSTHSLEDFQEKHVERIYKIGYQTNFKILPPNADPPSR